MMTPEPLIKPLEQLTVEEAPTYGLKAVRLGILSQRFHVVPGFAWPFDHQCRIDSMPQFDFPVILRSSHRLEDLSHQSQAGRYPSFLNIQNE